ncbi:hypothetical protein [Paenibacillus sp. FSL R10-2734]
MVVVWRWTGEHSWGLSSDGQAGYIIFCITAGVGGEAARSF